MKIAGYVPAGMLGLPVELTEIHASDTPLFVMMPKS
jgi:hypothetical protein